MILNAEALQALAIYAGDIAMAAHQELPETLYERAAALRMVRAARQRLSDAERSLEAATAAAMGDKIITMEGLPTMERKWQAAKTEWSHEQIAARVAAASRDERILNEESGEIEGEAEAAARVLLGAAGLSYWRVGELKRLGIDPDEVRDKSEQGRWSIRFLENVMDGGVG